MRSPYLSLGCSCAAFLVLAACSDKATLPLPDGGESDASRDAAVDVAQTPSCTTPPVIAPGTATAHAEPLGAGAGQVRVGALTASQLPPDPSNLSVVAAGDIVMANSKIAVVIENAGPSDLYDPFGGKPVGIFKVRDGALVEAVDFNEAITLMGRYVLNADSVSIVSNGASGPAIVRAIGPLVPLPFLEQVLVGVFPDDLADMRVAIDWILAPDTDYFEMRVHVASPRRASSTVRTLQGFFQSSRMPAYQEETGFERPQSPPPSDWVAFVEDDSTSYLYKPASGRLTQLLNTTGFTIFDVPDISAEPCAITEASFGRFVVGGPGIDGLLSTYARTQGTPRTEIRGVVREANGALATRRTRVHVTDMTGKHLTRVWSDANGAFTVSVPTYPVLLTGVRRGELTSEVLTVAVATTDPQTITMKAFGALRVVTTDGTRPIPARLQLIPTGSGPVPSVPVSWGEPLPLDGRLHTEFVMNGDGTLYAPVGTHRLVVSRGMEYDLYSNNVTVTANTVTTVNVAIRHIVATPDTLCADYHIHSTRSPDAADSPEHKVRSIAADGVEIAVRTEHEFIADYQPVVTALGVGDFVRGIGGEELTTFAYGHFNVFPLIPDGRVNGGAYNWVGKTPPMMMRDVRARPERPAIIINHPRLTGLFDGYFTTAGYDPVTRTARLPALWDEEFVNVEVFNESDFRTNLSTTVRDWFSFLTGGRRVFAVGSSDSHNVDSTPVGYPRTCLRVGTDDPRALDPEVFKRATESGFSYVSGGLFLDVVGPGGKRPGEEALNLGSTANFRVIVRGAEWVDADRLQVWVDGVMTEQLPIDTSTQSTSDTTIRFEGDVSVPVPSSPSGGFGHVIFVAEGDDDLGPVHPQRRPFAVTNPIFIQRD